MTPFQSNQLMSVTNGENLASRSDTIFLFAGEETQEIKDESYGDVFPSSTMVKQISSERPKTAINNETINLVEIEGCI